MIRFWRSFIFAGCLIAMGWPARSLALTIDSEQQFQFAEALFNSGQYQRAAEEYQRLAFFFPEDFRHRPALFKAGQSFLLAKNPVAALDRFKELALPGKLDSLALESYFMKVECYLQMRSITHAVLELNNLIIMSDDMDVRDRAYYRLGWLHIDQTDWPAAQQAFAKISESQRSRYRIEDLEHGLNQAGQLPDRNPTMAGMLSIVPGVGQLYCKRYEDALIAFAVNLGLFWAAHDAFDQDQYALGSLLSFVGLGFYAGNIYSAVDDAHKFNQRQKQQFGESLKRFSVLGLQPGDQGASNGLFFSLHVPF